MDAIMVCVWLVAPVSPQHERLNVKGKNGSKTNSAHARSPALTQEINRARWEGFAGSGYIFLAIFKDSV